MDAPTNVEQLRELFEAAISLLPEERQKYLARQADPDVRDALARMLEADAETITTLDRPALVSRWREQERIGNYRLTREIGAGGMGAVYLAEGTEPVAVAIKILHWRARSAEGLRRFAQERAILARLDHRNIARLIDGGTTADGHPYFVMEYVEGEPIHEYCAARKLGVAARLELVRQLSQAVQYSHQNLVVHRDLKPTNILVTAGGAVKLLDFGIAKLLDAAEVGESFTQSGPAPFTPDYASPEQIAGGAISTRSDVFALGVILYELLAGARPFSGDSRRVLRAICEEEPELPSVQASRNALEWSRGLEGELDKIVFKALRKEPERRYISVEQLDEDLRRYLAGLPVRALADTLRYRAQKFFRRNRAAVMAGIACGGLLAGAFAATFWEWRIATREAAEARAQKVSADTNRLVAEQALMAAEAQSKRAEEQRANAERRLAAVGEMARAVLAVNDTVQGKLPVDDIAESVAQQTRDSVGLALREGVREPSVASGFSNLMDSVPSNWNPPAGPWQVPGFWRVDESVRGQYSVGLDSERARGAGSSLYLRAISAQPRGAIRAFQTFQASSYRATRVRLTAWVQARSLAGTASLWLRAVTFAGTGVTAAPTASSSISGSTTWRRVELPMEIPADAAQMELGIRLQGEGTLWADDFSIEVLGFISPKPANKGPVNLDFKSR